MEDICVIVEDYLVQRNDDFSLQTVEANYEDGLFFPGMEVIFNVFIQDVDDYIVYPDYYINSLIIASTMLKMLENYQKNYYYSHYYLSDYLSLSEKYSEKREVLLQSQEDQKSSTLMSEFMMFLEEKIDFAYQVFAQENLQGFFYYALSNTVMSFTYFSFGQVLTMGLSPFKDNTIMHFCLQATCDIVISSVFKPKTINECKDYVFGDKDDSLCVQAVTDKKNYLGEATEELLGKALKKMSAIEEKTSIYNVPIKLTAKLAKRAVVAPNALYSKFNEELFTSSKKTLQSHLCDKIIFYDFKQSPLHSLALPYCRDAVGVISNVFANMLVYNAEKDMEKYGNISIIS